MLGELMKYEDILFLETIEVTSTNRCMSYNSPKKIWTKEAEESECVAGIE